MSNLLKMAKVQSLLSLHAQGWSARRIARELGVDRDTVRKYVSQQSCASANPTVTWVDEAASMSADARLYNSGAQGARSNVATKLPQAPSIPWTEGGSARVVRFDGEGPGLLIDRKLAVVTSGKAQSQALRQSAALQQNNLRGLWEVPDAAQAARARAMFHDDYDPLGRLSDYVGPDGLRHYEYDGLGQLTVVTDGEDALESYDYDAQGNRETGSSAAVGSDVVYEEGPYNRIASDGQYSYEYDAIGNRTARVSATGEREEFAYDYRNRLVGVTFKNTGDTVTKHLTYLVDPYGNRIGTLESDGADNVVSESRSVFAGNTLLFDLNAAGEVGTRYFTLGGETVAQLRAGHALEWLVRDEIGSVRAVVTACGTVAATYAYDAYGNLTDGAADATTRILWTGLLYDRDTNTYLTPNRIYDPLTGKWLQNDPIGFAGGTTNLSEYVGNGPTNAVDPSGLAGEPSGSVIESIHRFSWNLNVAVFNLATKWFYDPRGDLEDQIDGVKEFGRGAVELVLFPERPLISVYEFGTHLTSDFRGTVITTLDALGEDVR